MNTTVKMNFESITGHGGNNVPPVATSGIVVGNGAPPVTDGGPAIDVAPSGVTEFLERKRIVYDGFITQVLDNNLHELEELRRQIEMSQKKDCGDVRDFDTVGSRLLAGIEGPVDYSDLVNLIRDFRSGLARRRAA